MKSQNYHNQPWEIAEEKRKGRGYNSNCGRRKENLGVSFSGPPLGVTLVHLQIWWQYEIILSRPFLPPPPMSAPHKTAFLHTSKFTQPDLAAPSANHAMQFCNTSMVHSCFLSIIYGFLLLSSLSILVRRFLRFNYCSFLLLISIMVSSDLTLRRISETLNWSLLLSSGSLLHFDAFRFNYGSTGTSLSLSLSLIFFFFFECLILP